jgi:hypothetical protein
VNGAISVIHDPTLQRRAFGGVADFGPEPGVQHCQLRGWNMSSQASLVNCEGNQLAKAGRDIHRTGSVCGRCAEGSGETLNQVTVSTLEGRPSGAVSSPTLTPGLSLRRFQ